MNRPVRRAAPMSAALLVTALSIAACNSTGATTNGRPESSGSTAPSGRGANQFGGRSGGAAASGKIAEIDGDTMQVQGTTTQSAVTVTAKTTYTQRARTTLAAVRPGTCVVAISGSATGSSGAGTATAIMISQAVNGSCALGARRNGTPTAGFPTRARPTGAPTGFPSGARDGASRFGAAVAGKVMSVSGSTIIVAASLRTPGGASASPATSAKTITVGSSTTYTHTVSATRSALKVGLCADAFGRTGSTGAVTATRVALSSPTSGTCDIGFGAGAPGRG